jgi:hypothetical protein
MAMRHLADQPLATRSPTVTAGHVCGCSGFIDEYELYWIELGCVLNHALRAASGRSCSAACRFFLKVRAR